MSEKTQLSKSGRELRVNMELAKRQSKVTKGEVYRATLDSQQITTLTGAIRVSFEAMDQIVERADADLRSIDAPAIFKLGAMAAVRIHATRQKVSILAAALPRLVRNNSIK